MYRRLDKALSVFTGFVVASTSSVCVCVGVVEFGLEFEASGFDGLRSWV